jgi:thioredoxin-related protein
MVRLLRLLLCWLVVFFAWPVAANEALPEAKDLQRDAQEAARNGAPLVLFFAADSCHYCKTVEDLYLGPMAQSDLYRGRVQIRMIQIERDTPVRGFDGRLTTHRALAQRLGVKLTPDVKFVDPQGKELVPDLLGLSSPDFYGSYLDESVQAAITKMRGASPGNKVVEKRGSCSVVEEAQGPASSNPC